MIIDYELDPDFASLHMVLDAETGSSLERLTVVYADDESGLMRVLRNDSAGQKFMVPASNPRVMAAQEVRRPIRIVPRPDCGLQPETRRLTIPSTWEARYNAVANLTRVNPVHPNDPESELVAVRIDKRLTCGGPAAMVVGIYRRRGRWNGGE